MKPLSPAVVAFDIGFYDPAADPAEDRALADAIKDSGNVILAMQGAGSSTAADGAVRYNAEQVPILALRQAAAGLASVNIDPDDDGRARKAELVVDTPSGRYYALPLVAGARSLLKAQVVSGDETAMKRQGDTLVLPGRGDVFRPDRVMTRLGPSELLAAIDREMPAE